MEIVIENSFKKFPSRDWLAKAGTAILNNEYPSNSLSFWLRPNSKNPILCHVFAKHEDAISILGPKLAEHVDLSLYDKALKSGGGGAEFFISDKDKTEQWALLLDAMKVPLAFNRNPSEKLPSTQACPASFMDHQTQHAISTAISIIETHLKADSSLAEKLDPIRDYGYLAAFILARDTVGLNMPKSRGIPYRVLSLFNRLRNGDTHALPSIEIQQANELVFWIEVMFGHLFMNPGDHNKPLLWASRIISKRYRKIILLSLKAPKAGSLLYRMQSVRMQKKYSDKDFNELATNIAMELIGSFQYLTGRAFAGVVESIQGPFSETLRKNENALVAFNHGTKTYPRAMIDEALRHNSPTGFIFRTASKDFEYNGINIEKGNLLCVLSDQAVKDSSVFSTPETFIDPEKAQHHQSDYLAFGSPDIAPSEFAPTVQHHPCFGQYWARPALALMLRGLEKIQSSESNKRDNSLS